MFWLKKLVLCIPLILLLTSCAVLHPSEQAPTEGKSEILGEMTENEPEQSVTNYDTQHPTVPSTTDESPDADHSADKAKAWLSDEERANIINHLEDHYADMFRWVGAREWLILDVLQIDAVDDLVHIKYDFYEIVEGWSLRIGTVTIGKNYDGKPYIVGDEIDEEAMKKVEKDIQEWAGIQAETEENPALNFTITEGFNIQTQITGLDFDVKLPKVTHTKNSEIENYYAHLIKDENTMLENYRVKEYDFSDWELRLFTYPNAYYEIRQAKGLVSVQIIRDDLFWGLTFDNDGKIYTNEDIFAIYGISYDAANDAIMNFMDEHYNEIIDCYIFNEDTLYCSARNGGDLAHGYLLSSKDGIVTADSFSR